jgi:hypothetical protein
MKPHLTRIAQRVAALQSELASRLFDTITVVTARNCDSDEEMSRRLAEADRAALDRAGLAEFPPGLERTTVIIRKMHGQCEKCDAVSAERGANE